MYNLKIILTTEYRRTVWQGLLKEIKETIKFKPSQA
jgi:hypothetical protein